MSSTYLAIRVLRGVSSSSQARGIAPSSQYGARSHPSAVPPNHLLSATSGQNRSRFPVSPSAWRRICRCNQPDGRTAPRGRGRNAGSASPCGTVAPCARGAAHALVLSRDTAPAATPAATLVRNDLRSIGILIAFGEVRVLGVIAF